MGMYWREKFQDYSIILTSVRPGGGIILPPLHPPTQNDSLKNPPRLELIKGCFLKRGNLNINNYRMFAKIFLKKSPKWQRQEQKEIRQGDMINKQASHRSLGTITKQFKYLVERAVEKEISVKPGNFSLW